GDYRRMDAHRGAGDRRRDRQRDGLGQRPDHRPHERALALLVVPGVEVIGDPQAFETRVLRKPGLTDQVPGSVLLAGQEEADASHGRRLPGPPGRKPPPLFFLRAYARGPRTGA